MRALRGGHLTATCGLIGLVRPWNAAAYEVIGGAESRAGASAELIALQDRIGGPLPAAVQEWYRFGGDQRLALVSCNQTTRTQDFTDEAVARFLAHGYLLLETDSQNCCRWVVAASSTNTNPPVYLIDPDDDTCATRSRYADTFCDYAFSTVWDAVMWSGEMSAEFDHPLPSGDLDSLRSRLTVLPTTYGWAMNQGCDTVYRFDGTAKVAVAVTDDVALWSAIDAPSAAMRDALAEVIGATG